MFDYGTIMKITQYEFLEESESYKGCAKNK